jgi:hypothetical protein
MPAAIPGPPPIANATVAGLLSAVAQSIGGDKTFVGKIINSLPLGLVVYTTGTLPSAASHTGSVVYNSTTSKVMFSDGAAWVALDVSVGSFVSKTGDTMTGTLTITGADLLVDSADNTLFVDATANRVGIGTATPADKLDIATGGLAVRGATAASGAGVFVSHATSITTISSVDWAGPTYRALRTESSTLSLRTGAASPVERVLIGATGNVAFDTNVLFVDAVNNRVGILSVSPSSPLEVAGVIHSTTGGFKFPDNTTQTSAAVHRVGDTMTGALVITGAGMTIDSADNTLVVDATNNRVGIGVAAPARPLDLRTSLASDYLMQIQNTNVTGASGIAFLSNGGTERLQIGYGNPSFSSPSAGVNFWHTDGVTDTVIAHAGVEFHRFQSNGSIKFDQADNLLTIDSGNNRIGVGVAAPASGYIMEIKTSLAANARLLKLHNTNNAGHGSIDFYNAGGGTVATLGYSGTTVSDSTTNAFSMHIPSGFTLRNGLTDHHTFTSTGNVTFDVADNVFTANAGTNQVGINTAVYTGAAGFTHPLIVELGNSGTRSQLIRGVGTIRKGLSIQDSTNNRTWTWDHSTAGNNNRLEAWYHNGTSEFRAFTLTTDGKLGINNVTPSNELDVSGSAAISGGLTVDTNTLVVDAAADRVGIGTTPGVGNKLDVAGKLNVTGDTAISGGLTVDTDTLVLDATTNRVGIAQATPAESLDVGGTIRSNTAAVTGIAGTGITVNYNGTHRRGCYKVTVINTAWTAGALNEDKTILTIPAKCRIVSVIMDTTVAYAGTGATTYTMRFGTTTNGQELMLSHSVFATGTKGLVDADLGASINRANAVQGGHIPSWTATTDLKARLTSDVNISLITAGTTVFYITVENL